MPTVRTVTVKSSGGDYSSLSAAEAGEQGDLVTLDRQLDIECYSMTDTTVALFNGWTTDATRYIRIFTPTAERHSGVWTTGKYNLDTTSSNSLEFREDYWRIEGLQVRSSNASNIAVRTQATAAAGSVDMQIESCIVRGSVVIGSGAATIRNTICYESVGAGISGTSITADNCTSIAATHAYSRSGGTWTLRNCYAHGGTDGYTGTITRTTCAHSSATVFSGSTASVAHSTANFTNVTGGSEDYHLVAGASSLIDTGTDLSGTFTNDIDGAGTRTGAFDIGADEYVAPAGGGQPTWKRYGGVPFSRGQSFAARVW